MGASNDGEFKICKLTALALLISAAVLTGVAELIAAGIIQFSISVSEEILEIITYICIGIAVCLTGVSLYIRRLIRQVDSNVFSPVLLFWTKQLRKQASTAAAVFIVPLALFEFIIGMGFVLFLLSNGDRMYFYIAIIWSLPLFLLHYPGDEDKRRLAEINEKLDQA